MGENAMQWNRYQTIYQLTKHRLEKDAFNTELEYYNSTVQGFINRHEELKKAIGDKIETYEISLYLEREWVSESKPFYRMWPFISEVLQRLDLCKVPVISLNMPHSCISVEPFDSEIQPFLFGVTKTKCGCCDRVNIAGRANGYDHAVSIPFDGSSTFGEILPLTHDGHPLEIWARLAIAIALMHNDPEIITPMLCKKYQGRAPNLTEYQIKLLQMKSAKNFGGIGYEVGKHIESVPHVRRPHPALVWTGEGRKVPKIILRKGCIVKRTKATTVPTGYRVSLVKGD